MRRDQKMSFILDDDINIYKSLIRDVYIVESSFNWNLYQEKR